MTAVAELVDRGFGKAVQEVELLGSNELTPEEEERINAFTDVKLKEFTQANETIHRLLYEEAP